MRYAVAVFRPDGYVFTRAFDEVALTIHEGLASLGHDSRVTADLVNPGCRTILLGANEFGRFEVDAGGLAPDTVLYNLEQLAQPPGERDAGYLQLLARFPVWDYSRANLAWLRGEGVVGQHLPIGWAAGLERIAPTPVQDIDILFYGCMNPRRHAVLAALHARGFKVLPAYGVYGAKRDALIARARIVLNIHFYETKIFEVVRVSYLLANGVCVVSEDGLDPDEVQFSEGVAFAAYDDLVERCVQLLGDAAQRRALAQSGRRLMRERRIETLLQPLL